MLFRSRLRLVGGQRVDVAPQAGVREPAIQRVVGETRRIDRLAAFGGADRVGDRAVRGGRLRSEEHTSELQSLMRISYAVFCLKQKKTKAKRNTHSCPEHKTLRHP